MTTGGGRRLSSVRLWLLVAGCATVVAVLALQKTKQAMLPARQTPVLGAAALCTIVGAAILLSGWGRDAGWSDAQRDLGAIVNNFYEPRREAFVVSFGVGVGVLCALWWALATWAVLLGGVRRGSTGRGLLDFEIAALMGAIVGGIAGAVIGVGVGHWWETRHRRQRLARRMGGGHA